MLEDRAKVDSFTRFVREVEPRLRHSLIPSVGLDAATEATAEALEYGWEHWDRGRHGAVPSPSSPHPVCLKKARNRGRVLG